MAKVRKPVSPTCSASTLHAAIDRKYPIDGYVALHEVRDATGFDAGRSADAITIGMYKSRGLQIEGFEIKVSRSDWLQELKDARKAEAWMRYCHRWWLVTHDANIVFPGELPATWGLLVLNARGRLDVAHMAPPMVPEPLSMKAFTALMQASRSQVLAGEAERIRAAREDGAKAGEATRDWRVRDVQTQFDALKEKVDELERLCDYPVVRERLRYNGTKPEEIARIFKLLQSKTDLEGELDRMKADLKWRSESADRIAANLRGAYEGLIKQTPESGIEEVN